MKEEKILKHDPLSEAEEILRDDFYGKSTDDSDHAQRRRRRNSKPKPTHYKVICISMYTKDIENLNAMVAELKRRGHTKANKSQLIRIALAQMDIDKIPTPNP